MTYERQPESSIELKKSDGLVDEKSLYRMSGISAFVIGIGYLIIIALYVPMGAPPSDAEAWLMYLAKHTTAWWAILGLSVLTDFLFVPVMASLYLALKGINKNAMLIAAACVGFFVVSDLAITWTNYASLIAISGDYIATTNEVQRTFYLAAVHYASSVLESSLLGVYVILVPAIGFLITGLVMLKGIFNKTTAYLTVASGILGIISVVGPIFVSALGLAVILASTLTLIWCLFVGHKLYKLGQ